MSPNQETQDTSHTEGYLQPEAKVPARPGHGQCSARRGVPHAGRRGPTLSPKAAKLPLQHCCHEARAARRLLGISLEACAVLFCALWTYWLRPLIAQETLLQHSV